MTSPVPSSVIMTGQVEERGLFKGRIKLVGEGGTPNELVTFGELNINPETFDRRKYFKSIDNFVEIVSKRTSVRSVRSERVCRANEKAYIAQKFKS